ncbi:hypothetical protein N6H14_08115 [Paenibacillus sp. CC-CFT747]|nr:hypothetical protein N6H14_08115 [Paenibacillus sp. CC-CFT747]
MKGYTHRVVWHSAMSIEAKRLLADQLLGRFVPASRLLKLKFWPGDYAYEGNPHYAASTYGVRRLERFACSRKSLDLGMEQLVCPVTEETARVMMAYEHDHHGHILPYFHLELYGPRGERMLYSGDFGDDLLVHAGSADLPELQCIKFG